MNILTFDIEEWYLQKMYLGNHAESYRKYDYYLDIILNKLDERELKATFFCVGGMGTAFPEVVRKIEERGHEIGCHSFKHMWLNKMTRLEVIEDTKMAVDVLEQCVGKKIKSYRAPAFTIGQENSYVFEILSQCGIERDASVFPAVRDFGGFSQFGSKSPTMTSFNGVKMKEFPICTTRFFRHDLTYSGGGYFRFLPLSYIKKEMSKTTYCMTYFHIGDLVPEFIWMNKEKFEEYYKISGSMKNRAMRCFKNNIGKNGAFTKFLKLINTENFINLEQADNMIDWSNVPLVTI